MNHTACIGTGRRATEFRTVDLQARRIQAGRQSHVDPIPADARGATAVDVRGIGRPGDGHAPRPTEIQLRRRRTALVAYDRRRSRLRRGIGAASSTTSPQYQTSPKYGPNGTLYGFHVEVSLPSRMVMCGPILIPCLGLFPIRVQGYGLKPDRMRRGSQIPACHRKTHRSGRSVWREAFLVP